MLRQCRYKTGFFWLHLNFLAICFLGGMNYRKAGAGIGVVLECIAELQGERFQVQTDTDQK